MKRLLWIAIVAASLGCSHTGDPTSDFANVQVSFITQRPAAPLASGFALRAGPASDTIVMGSDTLVVDQIEIVLREIELQRLEITDCDTTVSSDACEKFDTGPVLVDLPLGNVVQQVFAVDVPEGTYTEIEFDIHKPDDDNAADSAFIVANPDFERISIRVRGTFNGQAFTYTTDLNVEQELTLMPLLVITESVTSTNVTILVDIDRWFRTPTGALVDPASANDGGVNENLVKNNIENSFEAFEDPDRDGDDG